MKLEEELEGVIYRFLVKTLIFLASSILCEVKWSHSVVSNSAIPWTIVHQIPLSMEFCRQEYWSGLPFPSPGDLPNPGIKPRSPAFQADTLPSEPRGNQTQVSHIAGRFFTCWVTREAPILCIQLQKDILKLICWPFPKNMGKNWMLLYE